MICIQGDWSNVVDAKLKGRLATAMGIDSRSPYSPLYARAVGTPKPWGVTALFAEYTGTHPPLDVDWTLERGVRTTAGYPRSESEAAVGRATRRWSLWNRRSRSRGKSSSRRRRATARAWILDLLGVCGCGQSCRSGRARVGRQRRTSVFPVDGADVRKLLTTMWFRTVLARLSAEWHERLLNALIEHVSVSDHPVKLGRQTLHLRELTYAQLQEIGSTTPVSDAIRPDLDLLITVGRFWGADAVKRFRFVEVSEPQSARPRSSLLDRFLN